MYNIETDKFDSIDIGIDFDDGYDDIVRVMYTIGIKCYLKCALSKQKKSIPQQGYPNPLSVKDIRKIVQREIKNYINGKYENKQNNM